MNPISPPRCWQTGAPLLRMADVGMTEWIAMKDPSIVKYDDRWHMFCTLRGRQRSHAIVYSSFKTFDEAGGSLPVVLPNHDGYFCAPQVFFFTPHRRWYLICQAKDPNWSPTYQAAFATTTDIAKPDSWSPLGPMGVARPRGGVDPYLDFWVICAGETAHLFFTSDNGKMWRSETAIADFPYGWANPVLAFEGDIFEASHIYRVAGQALYLNLIEAQLPDDRREYKAYVSEELDGEWTPVGEDGSARYASPENVRQTAGRWTDSISHGELLRVGVDEKLEAAPNAPFIFQGVLHKDREGEDYGDIPWNLGLLIPSQLPC